jgi:RNA polymerase sigma-70 factor (ECF subfamily)
MDYESYPHKKFINDLRKGNESAYVFLLEKYHRLLFTYANSLTRDKTLSQDIVQNVFIKTWEQRKRLKPDVSIKNFLYRLVYTEFIDQYRKLQSTSALEKKYADTLNQFIEKTDIKEINSILDIVKKEIEKLPPKCKEVFLLSRKEGLTNVEIADYLKLSTKTVEAHITKAFAILRVKLNKTVLILFLNSPFFR